MRTLPQNMPSAPGLSLSWPEGGSALRMVAAALLAYGAALSLGLANPYSAVISALIVMRSYAQGAIRLGLMRLAATAGAILVAFAALWLRQKGVADIWLLGLALAPLSLIAAYDNSWRTALITVLIMIAAPSGHALPQPGLSAAEISLALMRAGAVGLGAVIGVLVSVLVLPQRHAVAVGQSARKLTLSLLTQLRAQLDPETDRWASERQDRRIRRLLMEMGQMSRDQGRKAASDNDASRLVGLVRHLQSVTILLRSEWRRLPPEALAGRQERMSRVIEGMGADTPGLSPDTAAEGLSGLTPHEDWLWGAMVKDAVALDRLTR